MTSWEIVTLKLSRRVYNSGPQPMAGESFDIAWPGLPNLMVGNTLR